MSVRVNLLPQAAADKQEASRQRSMVALGAVVLLAVLGLAYWWQVARVNDAEEQLAIEQARVDEVQAEVRALGEFAELQERQRDADDALRTTLAGEVTFAGILQDLAAVIPSDAQVDSLGISVGDERVDETTGARSIGAFTMTGKTLTSHAPGVERLLISLDKIASFSNVFVTSSSLDEPDDDVASFSVEGDLGPELLTRRYADGLPEELR